MGYIMHDAIVVTAFRVKDVEIGHAKAIDLGLPVSDVVAAPLNGYFSFMIAPDGSKEGWADSDEFDAKRLAWEQWAAAQYSASVFLDWAHIRFGESPAYVSSASNEED